jgi:serine/threonine protein kinase
MPETLPVLQGRFLLQHKLGEGGMAEVWQAYDNRLGVWRAVKLLLADYARRTKLRKRFESEARAMAVLEHPNIVRVYDVGSEGPRSWIVMELCDGGSLESWLDSHGPMPPRLAVDVTLQFAAGVAHAHAHGVVHRDIKPQNVLISAKGVCKVTDFGIAHFEDESLTRTGTVMGTLGFMAPEQRSDAKKVDRRSDIYSVAATLFTLLTGRVEMDLFAAGQDPSILDGVPEPLCPVLERAVSYHREERYQTVEELVKALQEVRRKLPENPANTAPLAVPVEERPARPSLVEQALAEASRSSAETVLPPVPGETLLPSYDLFDGASIPPSLRRAAEQRAPNRKTSVPPISMPPPHTPEPEEDEPTFVEGDAPPTSFRPVQGGASAIPWVPSTERGRKDEDYDFESLYVQDESSSRGPDRGEIGSGLAEEGTVAAEAQLIAPDEEKEDQEDPGKHAGKVFDPMWALGEAWKFITQLLSGMLQFASQPVQYLAWPVVAALAIGAVASFHGASSVVTAQTSTTTDLRLLTAVLDRSTPDLIEDISAQGGSRTALEAEWARYQGASTPAEKEAAAVALSRRMEEQVTRLDEPSTPQEIRDRKSLQSRVQALTRQRAAFVDAQEQWRAAASTTTGQLAVHLGLAGEPPPER